MYAFFLYNFSDGFSSFPFLWSRRIGWIDGNDSNHNRVTAIPSLSLSLKTVYKAVAQTQLQYQMQLYLWQVVLRNKDNHNTNTCRFFPPSPK